MAPPRHNHHHTSNHHHNGQGGSPFPPLGLAAANATISSSSPLHSTSAFSSSNGSSNNENTTAATDSSSGLPPAPTKVDSNQAQACRLQDAYWSDEEEDLDCPLCLEEIDLSDANFKPCPCGYQICRFCWHHIKQNLNGRCPACRRKYSDNTVEFKAMSQDEIKRLSQAKKQKEREKRELEQMNRKHLANMRVVQKNLVYVVGLDPKLAKEELIPTLRSNEFFGQYGRISKILISKRTTASKLIMGTQESAIGVYVTYVRKEDAARAIVAIDGSKGPDGKTIRASYGTTKYCTNYLRNLPCTNTICTYLHEPGEEADSFTKEDLSTLRHAAKDTENKSRPVPPPASFSTTAGLKQEQANSGLVSVESMEASALPKTASWASGRPGGASIATGNATSGSTALRDQDLPPLSALQQSHRKASNQQNRVPSSSTKIPTAPKGRLTSAAIGNVVNTSGESRRSESPSSIVSPSAEESAISSESAVPQSPLNLLAKQLPKGPSAMQNNLQGGQTREGEGEFASEAIINNSTTSTPPPAPPGLTKRASREFTQTPPISRPATPPQSMDSMTTEKVSSVPTYQPSSKAQALLDDMRSRREAEAHQPTKSPFPDFDATLSSFRDGDDFCFTFEESQIPANMKDSSSTNGVMGLSAFTPFALTHHDTSYFGRASPTPPPPPPGIATPTRNLTDSPAPPPGLFGHAVNESGGYTGRFDPFAPNAGEVISVEESKVEPFSSPFASIDQLRRTLNDEKALNGTVEEKEGDDARLSRFGFSKRRESPFFKTHDDLLGFVKGGAARLAESDLSPARQEQQQQQQSNEPANWLNDLQKRASAAHLQANPSHYSFDRSSGGGEYGNASIDQEPLLAHLINHRPMEVLPYNDPAIMSFARQQQAQAHALAQQQQQQQQHHQHLPQQQQQLHHQAHVSPQDSYGGIFNPFETPQQTSSYRSSASNYQQQPYGNHRTFA